MPIAEPISNCFNDSTNIKDIVLCIKELAERLSLLHEKGIVHRDIKPSNLYIYHDTWCFGDFGLVDYPEKSDITDKKESVGPKWTMAPEMKRDAANADGKKADVYSLAKTLWILLTHVTEGFDGQYDDSSPKIRLRSFLRYEYIVDIEILLRNATDNTPESRPSIQQFINVLDKWIQNSEEFKKSNLMEWNYIQKKLFKSLAPMRTEWDSKEAIVEIMNIISNTPNLNHMFLPDGGGMDLEHAIMSSNYTNCIELSCGPMEYIINPRRLIYQNISNNPDWSYFRLEVNNIEPSYIFDVEYYNEHSEEEIIDLGNSNFIHPKYWTYRHYDDKPLPKDSRLIIRVLKGSFVMFGKASMYNAIPSTYDGRHSKMNDEEFRSEVEGLKAKYEYYLDNKERIDAENAKRKELEDEIIRLRNFEVEKENEIKNENYFKSFNNFILTDINIDIKELTVSNLERVKTPIIYAVDIIYKKSTWNRIIYRLKKSSKFSFYKESSDFLERKKQIDLEMDAIFYTRENVLEVIKMINEKLFEFYDIPETNYSFNIIMKRIYAPSHLFTKQEIEDVLRSGDDELNNVLIVDEGGYVKLLQDSKIKLYERDTYSVINETYCAFNNYVGRYSPLYHLDDEYISCLEGWLEHLEREESVYKDYYNKNRNVEELKNEIKALIAKNIESEIWKS